jgi:membrane associated rhomboid family serine protease
MGGPVSDEPELMFIPYNTDASLYHYPIATVGTMALNVLLFMPVFFHEDPYAIKSQRRSLGDLRETLDDGQIELPVRDGQVTLKRTLPAPPSTTNWRLLTVEFGTIRPWQWLTASYMHADLLHLLGNLFVLWGFGLVVEGKVGWWRFLALYNLMGVVGWGLVQFVMLLADNGFGLGASLPIFGLLAITLIWAPENEMDCFLLLGFRPVMFEARIVTIATLSLVLQLAISVFHLMFRSEMGFGLTLTSEILHLIGAVLGLAVGIVMLRFNWVYCENWDLFSIWQGKNERLIADDDQDVREGVERMIAEERQRWGKPTRP